MYYLIYVILIVGKNASIEPQEVATETAVLRFFKFIKCTTKMEHIGQKLYIRQS